MKNSVFVLGSISLCVLGGSPSKVVYAQNTDSEIRNMPVSLNVEGATLYSTLKMLFSQAKADFTIVDSLKTLPVTVRINQPFRIALNSVLKATGQPITYGVENGVYHITLNAETPSTVIDNEPPGDPVLPKSKPQMRQIRVRNGSGLEIAALLGAKFIPWISAFYPPYVGSNPFASPIMGGGGVGGGLGNNAGIGGGFGGNSADQTGLANGFSGGYALPGLGIGFFGGSSNQGGTGNNGNNSGNGGR